MRGMLKWTVATCLALGLASVAQAQRQGPGFFGGPGALLQNEGVQKELSLSDEQKTKVRDALTKVREDNKDIIGKGRDMSREERQKLMKAFDDAIGGVLDAKQMKRFKQIQLQTQGAFAFFNTQVQEKLKLSEDQKGKIREIGQEAGKKMADLRQGGGSREENAKKFNEIRKETMDKIAVVLTDDQKKTWKEMTGKPFELQPGARRRNRDQ